MFRRASDSSVNELIKKLDDGSPFPVEVRKQLKLAIADLKRDLDCQYFMLRKLKRELHSKLPDHYIYIYHDFLEFFN